MASPMSSLRRQLFQHGAALFRWFNRKQVPVLMYHGVLPEAEALSHGDWLQVSTEEFGAQMAYLHRHYTPVSLRSLLASPLQSWGKPPVVVTFDDGYANNFHHALPVLQQFSIPATIFLATSYLGTSRFFWWDRLRLSVLACGTEAPVGLPARLKRLPPAEIDQALDCALLEAAIAPLANDAAPDAYRSLAVDELQQLKVSGLIDFGSHTAGHEIIEILNEVELDRTLATAAAALQGWGCSSELFAAPNGDYLDSQIPVMQRHGIVACASTLEGLWVPGTVPYRIPRLGIGRGMPIDRFALKLSGARQALGRLASRRRAY